MTTTTTTIFSIARPKASPTKTANFPALPTMSTPATNVAQALALCLILGSALLTTARAGEVTSDAMSANATEMAKDTISAPEAVWRRADAKEFYEASQDPEAFMVDIRKESAFNKEHIPGAVLIPLGALATSEDLPKNMSTPILVYCNSGNKSQTAAKELQKMGYTDVADLEPGIKGWKKEGLPVV